MPLPNNNGAAYKMSSWWGLATKEAGEEEGCNNSSSSSSSAQSNTSTIISPRTSVRDDVETAYRYSNSNNNSVRYLQREQPSMIPNTHHRTRNKRFVSSTNKTLLPAALISIFIVSIFTGYNIYHLYFNTPSNESIDTAVNLAYGNNPSSTFVKEDSSALVTDADLPKQTAEVEEVTEN